MIEFEERRDPSRGLSTLTAHINDSELMMCGKNFVKTVVHELIKQSVLIHRVDLENIVTEYILSQETRKYIEDKIRETIDNFIRDEVKEIFDVRKI